MNFRDIHFFDGIRLEKLTDFYLGWLAGIVDGEGCITVTNKGSPRVIVAMTTPLVKTLQQMTGLGSVRVTTRGNYRPMHHWTVYSAAGVYKLLSSLSPGMLVKRKQCDLMLRYCKGLLTNLPVDRGAFITEMTKLNKRGEN